MTEEVDGVRRSPASGIKVVVLGAGVAGLQAALECWRKGMDVEVVESAEKISPHGPFTVFRPYW